MTRNSPRAVISTVHGAVAWPSTVVSGPPASPHKQTRVYTRSDSASDKPLQSQPHVQLQPHVVRNLVSDFERRSRAGSVEAPSTRPMIYSAVPVKTTTVQTFHRIPATYRAASASCEVRMEGNGYPQVHMQRVEQRSTLPTARRQEEQSASLNFGMSPIPRSIQTSSAMSSGVRSHAPPARGVNVQDRISLFNKTLSVAR